MYYTRQELLDAADELEHARHTIQNCEKLAAIYNVLDHMFPGWNESESLKSYTYGYSSDSKKELDTIGNYGDSDFLETVSEKPEDKVWMLMDELMDTVNVLEPKLYDSVMRKLRDI